MLCDQYNFTSVEEATEAETLDKEKSKETVRTLKKTPANHQLTYPSIPTGSSTTNHRDSENKNKEGQKTTGNLADTSKSVLLSEQSLDKKKVPKKRKKLQHGSTSSQKKEKKVYLKRCIEKKLNGCATASTSSVNCASVAASSTVDEVSTSSPIRFDIKRQAKSSSSTKKKRPKKVGTKEKGSATPVSSVQPSDKNDSATPVTKKRKLKSYSDENREFLLPTGRYQYKTLHLLTEIRDNTCEVITLLKAESSSFTLVQYDNLDDFIKFDKSLESDKEVEKQLKLCLSNVGGATCHANIKAIMSKLMKNNLMTSFSLDGKGKKESFRNTNFMKVVKDCAQTCYDEKTVETAIGKILIRAPDRKGGGGRQKETDDESECQDEGDEDGDVVDDDEESEGIDNMGGG